MGDAEVAVLVAMLLNAIPFTLFGYAEQHIPSAVAGIAKAPIPLATVLGVWRGLGSDVTGALMAVAAAFCHRLGWVYLRRFLSNTGYSTFSLTGAQLTIATM